MALTELISGLRLDDSGEGGLFSQMKWFSVIPFLVMEGSIVFCGEEEDQDKKCMT